jgi:hypothetical protein
MAASSIYANCFGCKENLPNQSAHMHFGGGCLYEYKEDEDKDEEKSNKIEKKTPGQQHTKPKPKQKSKSNGTHH